MHPHRRRAGFTLIELLAVILIVGILSAILVSQLGGAEEAAQVQLTKQKLAMLDGVLEAYENEHGDYPPSSFTGEEGVPNEGTNVGIEALVVALWSNGWEAGGLMSPDELGNVDGDVAPRTLGDLGRELLEVVDAWGNPVAYLHRRDYGDVNRQYLTIDTATGEPVVSTPRTYKNPRTDRYYNANKYQLVSAGPDGRFGGETDDDITAFERE
jgi:prepilin-type N-terminal cleavage/methylation domain-containing protein